MMDKYLFLSIGFWGSRNSRWKGALQCLPWKLNEIKDFKAFLFAFLNGHQGNFWFLEGLKVYFLETSKRDLYYRKLCALFPPRKYPKWATHHRTCAPGPRPGRYGLHHTYSYGKHCGLVFVSARKKRHRRHSKIILYRCKINSTTGIRILENLH